ncbi:MAG: glycolate oxidase subunit GlcE [Nevskiaceae bacterium]|nr:MAG: glycolate oxidase subunit GlcE [Nevskiaceae bacterium]TBR71631.1 MAG: glycolate oxidase subunit GlcE [Nevskiaceae bacterium]
MTDANLTDSLRDRVQTAAGQGTALVICGSGSKAFLTGTAADETVDMTRHAGIVHYAPQELVLTVRAGTHLRDVEALLAEHGQMLAFEPPHYGPQATVGGTLAAGLSGPRRASAGAARDFVLGLRILNGRGEVLRFGGETIKNVAGYDVSRLMVGAFGTLGVLLDASFKVLPKPAQECTRVQDAPDAGAALKRLRETVLKPWPLSASAWLDGRLYLRLSGAAPAVAQAARALGGETLADDATFWRDLREQQFAFFTDPRPLWRLAVAPAATLLPETLVAPADRLMEWDGALRWVHSTAPAATLFAAAQARGGHATLWRNAPAGTPRRLQLPPALATLHQRLKAAFDPHGILNRGAFHPEP